MTTQNGYEPDYQPQPMTAPLPPVPGAPIPAQPVQAKTSRRTKMIIGGFAAVALLIGIGVATEDTGPEAPVAAAPAAEEDENETEDADLPGGATSAPVAPTTTRRSTPPPPPPAPALDVEEVEDMTFLTIVQADPELAVLSEGELTDLGRMICEYLRSGAGDVFDAGMMGMDVGFSPDTSGTMVGAAVGSYCPEFLSQIPG
jgi:Protein of unknown function (DUF732)